MEFKCNIDINKNSVKPFMIGSCKNCVHDGVCKHKELAEGLKTEFERYIFIKDLEENPLKMECKYFENKILL